MRCVPSVIIPVVHEKSSALTGLKCDLTEKARFKHSLLCCIYYFQALLSPVLSVEYRALTAPLNLHGIIL